MKNVALVDEVAFIGFGQDASQLVVIEYFSFSHG
jgi:hypothetical protein